MSYIIRVKMKKGAVSDMEVDRKTIDEAYSFCDDVRKMYGKYLDSIKIYEFKELVY